MFRIETAGSHQLYINMDDEADFSRSTAHTTVKRPGLSLIPPRRKKIMTLVEMEHQQPTGSTCDGNFHVRWLIESSVCARVLGPSGKRLKYLKESTRESNFQARISPKVQDAEFRVFSSYGSAMGVSKVAGLFVKFVYDEPENQLSCSEPSQYDFKLLIPEVFVKALVGVNEENLREIEEKSNALLSVERDNLPHSSEKCIHIFGPASVIQSAIYFSLETLKRVENANETSVEQPRSKLFDPKLGPLLEFKAGRPSDAIPRTWGQVGGASLGIIEYGCPPQTTKAITGASFSKELQLPSLIETKDVSQSIYTAYDIARDSKRTHLRQIVQLESKQKGSAAEIENLMENIRRITECKVKKGADDHSVDFEEDRATQSTSIVIEGAPEENALALFLIYRFLRKKEIKA